MIKFTFYAILDANRVGDYMGWCGRTNRISKTASMVAFEGSYELWEVEAESIDLAHWHLNKVIGRHRVSVEAIWRDNTSTQEVARAEAGVRLHKAAQPHCCHGRPMSGPRCPECMERVQHTSDCAWDGLRSVRK